MMTDVARPVSFIGEVVAKLVLGVPQWFRWVNFLMSKEALRHSRVWGEIPFFVFFLLQFFLLIFRAVFLQGTLRGFRFRLSMMSIKRQRPERDDPFILLSQDWLELLRRSLVLLSFLRLVLKLHRSYLSHGPMAVHQRSLTELFFFS